jgi:hypothetical protein
MIEAFFASGHAADLILGVLLIEAAWLRAGRGWSWSAIAALLGPSAPPSDPAQSALPLAASLPLHLMDLGARLKR